MALGMESYRVSRWVLSASLLTLAAGCDDSSGGGDGGVGGTEASSGEGSEAEAEADSNSETSSATEPSEGTSGPTTAGPTTDADDTGETADDSSSGDPSDDSTTGEPTADPRQPGTHAVTTGNFDLQMGDGVTVPLSLWIPDGEGPHPVVVFHHGFQLTPGDYTSYGQHLGSWGYVVIMPAMPGSLFDATTHVTLRQYVTEIFDWVEAVGAQAGGPLGGVADADTLGMSGHSLGGKISFLTASAEPRIDAVFGVDPVDGAGGPGSQPSPENPSVAPELMPLVVAPIGIVGETVNATGGLGGACAPAEDNFQQYFNAATSPAVEIEFLTANHMSFLDNPACGLACSACPAGTDDPATTRSMTQGYMVAFFEMQLRGNDAYRTYLAGDAAQADADTGLTAFQTSGAF